MVCLLIYVLVLSFLRLGFPLLLLGSHFDVEEKLLGREGGTESRGGCGYLLSLSEDEMSETMKDTVHLPHGGMY